MRLIKLVVENFRAIESETIVFDDVTVITGRNEAGKSTLIEALSLLISTKHSSRAAAVKDVQPAGRDVAPLVELTLSSGDYHMIYRKQWLKKPSTQLQILTPVPRQVTGGAAYDEFQRILATTSDLDLLGQLVIRQTDSLTQAGLSSIPAVRHALDDAAREEEHDDLLARIDQEFDEYWTGTGKEKTQGPLGRSRAHESEAHLRYSALKDTHEQFMTHARELDELKAQQEDLRLRTEQARCERDAAQKAYEHWQQMSDHITVAAQQVNQAQVACDLADRTAAQRRQMIDDLDSRRTTREQLAERQNKMTHEISLLEEAWNKAQAAEETAAEALKRADQKRTNAAQVLHEAHQQERLQSIQSRIDTITALTSQLDQLSDEFDGAIDDETISHLTELTNAVQVAHATAEAASTHIVIEAKDTDVCVDQQNVPAGSTEVFDVEQTTEIIVGTAARVIMTPPDVTHDHSQALDHARAALTTALADAGVESINQARMAARRNREISLEISTIKAQIAAHLDNSSLEELMAERDTYDVNDVAVSVEDARTAELLAADEYEQANVAAHQARASLDKAERAYQHARVQYESQHKTLALYDKEIVKTVAQLESDRERVSDEQCEADRQAAHIRLVAATNDHDSLDEKTTQADAKQISDRYEAATLEYDRLSSALTQTRERILGLAGHLDRVGADTMFTDVDEAEFVLTQARSERERIERVARGIKVLREVITRHKERAQSSYAQPFARYLEDIARPLFGDDLRVEVGDDLLVESRYLNGQTVAFDQLSVGAKEQMSILGRLAAAQLVASDGAPVILDDTLGYADPKRVTAVCDVINRVGRTSQIVILTCQPERFASVNGSRHSMTDRAGSSGSLR